MRFGSQFQEVHILVTSGESFFLGHVRRGQVEENDLKSGRQCNTEKVFAYTCVKTCLNATVVKIKGQKHTCSCCCVARQIH